MTEVASRDLRNHTADVLRRVAAGEEITITVQGRPVARLLPVLPLARRPFSKQEVIKLLTTSQADPGLRSDLEELAGWTDELGPIE